MPGYVKPNKPLWPHGEVDTKDVTWAATMAVTISDRKTLVNIGTMTADATLNVTIDEDTPLGAELILKVPAQTDGFDLTLGDGIQGPAVVGVTGKTKMAAFVYDGTNFNQIGTAVQID